MPFTLYPSFLNKSFSYFQVKLYFSPHDQNSPPETVPIKSKSTEDLPSHQISKDPTIDQHTLSTVPQSRSLVSSMNSISIDYVAQSTSSSGVAPSHTPSNSLSSSGGPGSDGMSSIAGSTDAMSAESLSDSEVIDENLSDTESDDEWEGLETTQV